MNEVNLLITIPLGIVIILIMFLLLWKLIKLEIYISAGISAIVTLLVYGAIALFAWPGADVFAIHLAVYLMTIYAMSIITRGLSGKAKWHWGPMLIIAFFIIVILTNTLFIFLAQSGLSPQWAERLLPRPQAVQEVQSRFPGTVSHDFREKEDQFNQYQQQRIEQTQRGWQVQIGWAKSAVIGQENSLIVEVKDRQDQSLGGATVTGRMMFPGNMKLDKRFVMSEYPVGRYTATLTMPQAGYWDFIIVIEKDQARHELRLTTTIADTKS